MHRSLPGSSLHGDSPSKTVGVGFLALLQGIFPTERSNPGLPHWRVILYSLSHQGNSRILMWVAYLFSRGSSWPRNQTTVSCIADRFRKQNCFIFYTSALLKTTMLSPLSGLTRKLNVFISPLHFSKKHLYCWSCSWCQLSCCIFLCALFTEPMVGKVQAKRLE